MRAGSFVSGLKGPNADANGITNLKRAIDILDYVYVDISMDFLHHNLPLTIAILRKS